MITITNKYIQIYFNQIVVFFAISIVFIMPFNRNLTLPFIWGWLILFLLQGNYKQVFKRISNNRILTIILVYFIINLISLTYTEELKNGYSTIVTQLSLILFPVLFGFTSEILHKNKFLIFKTFIISNLISGFACLLYAFYKSFFIINNKLLFAPNYKNFLYIKFSWFDHPTYTGMYMLFSILLLFYLIENKQISKLLGGIICFFLLGFIVLLSSRAIYLTSFLLAIIWLYHIKNRLKATHLILYISTIIILSITIIILNPRIQLIQNIHPSEKQNNRPEKTGRYLIFCNSIEVVYEHFFIGVGIGDVKKELVKKYKRDGLSDAVAHKLDAHNQFLETFISSGILGFILLILLLYYPFFTSNFDNTIHFLFIGFIIIISINFLFESVFNKFSGILFFSYFYNLFTSKFTELATKTE
jgi:O-antigen ligase